MSRNIVRIVLKKLPTNYLIADDGSHHRKLVQGEHFNTAIEHDDYVELYGDSKHFHKGYKTWFLKSNIDKIEYDKSR